MPYVSIIIPLYNEEENISDLYSEVTSVLDKNNIDAEVILVDDGSKDKTVEKLKAIAAGDSRIVVAELRRNFGQTAAMACGIELAKGDVIITLDGDLQNDPAEIPRMLEGIAEGYDLVAGWRKDRQDAMLSRKIPSMLANKLISKATKVQLHDYGCTLKAMKSEVAKNIKLYGEMHRFIPALAAEVGASIKEIPVNHRARTKGVSKYGISRTFRVILDLITVKFYLGYSTRPLHLFGMAGLGCGVVGGLTLALIIFQRIFLSIPAGSRPLLALSVLLILVGVQFLCFGLLAEMLVRTYHESQSKKVYTVRAVTNCGDIKSA